MTRSKQMLANTIYIFFLIAVSVGMPLLLIFGTLGTEKSVAGMIAAALSFMVLASYVLYTILLGFRNS